MHQIPQDLPVTTRERGMNIRHAQSGGMVVGFLELPAGTDFTPLFEGLPDDACHCPHWGYVVEGAVHLEYTDGTAEVAEAGEVFHWPPGHTAWVEEDTAFIEISPVEEFGEVSEHVARKMEESG